MSDTGRTAAPGGTIRAVVVDDSALMRQLLAETLGAQEGIAVVGTAADPYAARELIRALDPDVVVLDIEMPRMDGLTFLQKIMQLRPMPVVMCSALTAEGSDAAIRALELGAVDCVAKPRSGDRGAFADFCAELAASVRLAAGVRVQPHRAASSPRLTLRRAEGDAIIAIGASTGGVERIRELLERLPATAPPIAVVQHMAPGFLGSFAARLDRQTPFSVTLARDGLRLLPGSVAIAPGGAHLTVRRD
ncbi:MAG TPA: response regulator, partial [Alphaproteobacteria bacterium]|nr:response regulator [Alphaproteobacteria bacterium]